MAFKDDDDEIECEIIESYGVFSQGKFPQWAKSWVKEVNLVSWNGKPAKLDIRNWQKDHSKCGKGIALTREEAEELARLLNRILSAKGREEKARWEEKAKKSKEKEDKTKEAKAKSRAGKKPVPPASMEVFYDELELAFGAGPEQCKTARNTLLKKYHPDKNAGNIAFATRKTIKIKEAYEKLMAWWKENALAR